MSNYLHMPDGYDPLNALIHHMREEIRRQQKALEALELLAKQRDELREECARLRKENRELSVTYIDSLERQFKSPFTADMMDALTKGLTFDEYLEGK